MRPTPEIIVSGWFLFGVGLLSVTKFMPDRAVTSSKWMPVLRSACTATCTPTAIEAIAPIVRKSRNISEIQSSIARLEVESRLPSASDPLRQPVLSGARIPPARARLRGSVPLQTKLEKAQNERRDSPEPT